MIWIRRHNKIFIFVTIIFFGLSILGAIFATTNFVEKIENASQPTANIEETPSSVFIMGRPVSNEALAKISKVDTAIFFALLLLPSVFFMIMIQSVMWLIADSTVPKPVGTAQDKELLLSKLTALAPEKSPFALTVQKNGNIAVHWNIANATWYELFDKGSISKSYTLIIRLDDKNKIAFVTEKNMSLEVHVGLDPSLNFSFFSGWNIVRFDMERAYGIKSLIPFDIGEIYNFSFQPQDLRQVFLETLSESGWEIHPCMLSVGLAI